LSTAVIIAARLIRPPPHTYLFIDGVKTNKCKKKIVVCLYHLQRRHKNDERATLLWQHHADVNVSDVLLISMFVSFAVFEAACRRFNIVDKLQFLHLYLLFYYRFGLIENLLFTMNGSRIKKKEA